jgi:hypothetical protein
MNEGSCDFSEDVLSAEEQTVIDAQTAIGWRHFLFGRLASEWTLMQRRHVDRDNLDSSKFSGSPWTAKIIKHIWRAMLSHWTVRNKALHGETFQDAEFANRARLHPVITNLYTRQHELPRSDRVMFRKPLAARLLQPLSVLATWLSVVTLAFEAARVEPDSDLESERSDATPDHLSDHDDPPFGLSIEDPDE